MCVCLASWLYCFISSKSSTGLATPLAWYKCQNSQIAQKCLRESAKSDLVSLGRESQRVSRTVQTLFRTSPQNTLSHRARDCFGTLTPEARKHLSHSPFSTFGHFGCSDTCTRRAGSQHRTTKDVLRQYRTLSQRPCRVSRDRRQLSSPPLLFNTAHSHISKTKKTQPPRDNLKLGRTQRAPSQRAPRGNENSNKLLKFE